MDTFHPTLQKIRRLIRWLRPMQIPLHSARTSFFLILSLFPSLLLLLGLLRYTSYGVQELMDLVEGILPQSLTGIVQALVETSYRHSSGVVVSVSVLAALWSASKGTYGLLCGLNAVYGVAERRGYWRSRSISVVYTFGFLLVLVLTLVLHVFGTSLLDYLWMTTIPALLAVMNLVDLRFFLLLGLQTVLFTILYALLPSRRNRMRQSLPGAVLASLCWSVCSGLFSVYVQFFTGYTNIFGSVYALALGMLWLYFCINILFYGGAFNRFLAERRG